MKLTGITTGTALLLAASSAQSVTIMDNYIGANHHGYGDVIGSVNDFQINFMEVEINGTVLTASIDTTFAGKGDNGLFSDLTNGGTGIGYGDLFLSNAWTPDGGAGYETDDADSGTVWSHGFSLDNRWMNENNAGTGTLYSLGSADNQADIDMSDDFLNSGYFRNNHAVAVDRGSNGTSALNNTGTWDITGNSVDFSIDLAGTGLLNGSEIALHWGFTCVNVPAVPVPAAVWLFGSGLIGLLAIARRR